MTDGRRTMSLRTARWRALPGLLMAVLLVVVGVAMVATGRYGNDRAFGVTIVCVGLILLLFGPLLLPRRPPELAAQATSVPGWRLPRILLAIAACLSVVAATSALAGTSISMSQGTGRGITWRLMPVVMVPLAAMLVRSYRRGGARHRLIVDGEMLIHEHGHRTDVMARQDIAGARFHPDRPTLVVLHRAGHDGLTLNPRDFDASAVDLRRWIDHQQVPS